MTSAAPAPQTSDAPPDSDPPPALRRGRRSVALVFLLHGAAAGAFATRIPWLQEHLQLGTGQLGLLLAFPAIGAALAMPLASRVLHRYGARAAVRGLLTLWCLALALPALAPGPVTLAVALAAFGGTSGMADVAMNAQGVEVERRYGRSVMSGLHGLWSVGTLIGSAAGVGAVYVGTDARVHLALTAAVLTVAAQPACRGLLDVRPGPEEAAPPRFALPPRSALVIGTVGICAVLAEGASMDWSGIYLRDVTGGSETLAASAYTAFACTMAAARLVGDAVVRRLGPVRTVRWSGVVAATGGLVVVTAPVPAAGIAGFALIGVGIAVVVPLAFAAAGRTGAMPGQAIAGVATLTYTTGLVAPTLIGVVGEVTSLRVSFAVVTVACAVMVLTAGVLRPRGDLPGGTDDVAGADGADAGAVGGSADGAAGPAVVTEPSGGAAPGDPVR